MSTLAVQTNKLTTQCLELHSVQRYNRAGIKPRLGEEGGKGFGLAYAYVKPKQLSAARTPSCGSYCTLLIHLPLFQKETRRLQRFHT